MDAGPSGRYPEVILVKLWFIDCSYIDMPAADLSTISKRIPANRSLRHWRGADDSL